MELPGAGSATKCGVICKHHRRLGTMRLMHDIDKTVYVCVSMPVAQPREPEKRNRGWEPGGYIRHIWYNISVLTWWAREGLLFCLHVMEMGL